MEKEFVVNIILESGLAWFENIKALNELEALDIVHEKYKKKNILDVKVVK